MSAMRHCVELIAGLCIVGALPRTARGQSKTATRPPSIGPTLSGAKLYTATCAACHQATGGGLPEKYPPLAGSEIVAGEEQRLIRIVLHGLRGDVEVQGEVFSGDMPGWGPSLSNAQIASVLTYVRGAWGNTAAPIAAARVAEIRNATAKRKVPWTIIELANLPPRASP
jgi:mono/diheme cytochrome c family protein